MTLPNVSEADLRGVFHPGDENRQPFSGYYEVLDRLRPLFRSRE